MAFSGNCGDSSGSTLRFSARQCPEALDASCLLFKSIVLSPALRGCFLP